MSCQATNGNGGERMARLRRAGKADAMGHAAMKRLCQVISCSLVVCLAVAGAVGVNPFLHRVVEHGGLGAAHTHFGLTKPGRAETHSHDHGSGHVHSRPPPQPRSDSIFAHSHRPYALPGISLNRLWHSLSHFFEPPAPSESPSEDSSGHEHHSLYQLMAGGLVDQPLDASIRPPPSTAVGSIKFSASTPFIACEWNAQMASRGPPFRQG